MPFQKEEVHFLHFDEEGKPVVVEVLLKSVQPGRWCGCPAVLLLGLAGPVPHLFVYGTVMWWPPVGDELEAGELIVPSPAGGGCDVTAGEICADYGNSWQTSCSPLHPKTQLP